MLIPGEAIPRNEDEAMPVDFGAGRKNSFRLSMKLARKGCARAFPAASVLLFSAFAVRRYVKLAKTPSETTFLGSAKLGTDSLVRRFAPQRGEPCKFGWAINFNMLRAYRAIHRSEFVAV